MSKCLWVVALVGVFGYALQASAEGPGARAGASHARAITSAGAVPGMFAKASSSPIRALLRKRVEKVDWVETTFEEVLDWLGEQAAERVNILPRWNALNAEGVDRDSLITLKLKHTMVAEVLDEVLDQLSEDGQLRYRGERNMLKISTKSDFGRKMEVRVYDVTDILFRIPDMGRSAPTVDLDAASRSGGSGGGGGGGRSIFKGASTSTEELEEEEQDVEERMEQMKEMIQAMIAPESWEETGGGRGRIEIYGQRFLVVRNTVEVHELFTGYFKYD